MKKNPFETQITIRISRDTREVFEKLARKEKRKLSEILRFALEEQALRSHEPEEKAA